jgi:hypothetical protein
MHSDLYFPFRARPFMVFMVDTVLCPMENRNRPAIQGVFNRLFTSACACVHQALAKTPSQGTTRHTDDLARSLGLSCVRGASLEETLGENSPLATSMPATPGTEVQSEDHRNALDRKVLQKTPVLAMAQAQTRHRSRKCTKVASEPI